MSLDIPLNLFQSTLPSQEETDTLNTQCENLAISIHSSLAGRDLKHQGTLKTYLRFQSTLPSQEETTHMDKASEAAEFQSTLPSQEETKPNMKTERMMLLFQSTLPSQEETKSTYRH